MKNGYTFYMRHRIYNSIYKRVCPSVSLSVGYLVSSAHFSRWLSSHEEASFSAFFYLLARSAMLLAYQASLAANSNTILLPLFFTALAHPCLAPFIIFFGTERAAFTIIRIRKCVSHCLWLVDSRIRPSSDKVAPFCFKRDMVTGADTRLEI